MGENETLNEEIQDEIDDATVMTVPLDATLKNSGEAADAKAVGDALELKADKADLQTTISVNGQKADNQGLILVSAEDIPLGPEDETTLADKIRSLGRATAEDIPMSDEDGAKSVADAIQEALDAADNRTAEEILWQADGTDTIKQHVDALGNAVVKSVNGTGPDDNGDVEITVVPYAENLQSDDTQRVTGEFIRRTTGGSASLTDGDAWLIRVMGNSVHEGFVAESIQSRVIPIARTMPPDITAVLDESAFLYAVESAAGTYSFAYGADGWDQDPAGYGITVSNEPVSGDLITVIVTVEEPEAGETTGESTGDGTGESEEQEPVITVQMSVTPAARSIPAAIAITLDRDAFVETAPATGTYNFYYTSQWSEDPAEYGITVSNEPVTGDQIHVEYVKEERGEITIPSFTRLAATGWNLYESGKGYARVVKYSDTYGYRIGGSWTALQWAETEDGERQTINPDGSGDFMVPGDGYLFVTGGKAANTYILTTWSDWEGATFTSYKESAVNLSSIMRSCFPFGLARIGDARDEIDMNEKTAISRIERMEYNAANLAEMRAAGRTIEYDVDYIYAVRENPVVTAITCETAYSVSEYGLEFFDGATVPVYAEVLYGTNLKDKLRRDVVTRGMTVAQVMGV